MKKEKKDLFEGVNKFKRYEPIYPDYRGGFRAQITKTVKKDNLFYYNCGSQQFIDAPEDFFEQYVLVEPDNGTRP